MTDARLLADAAAVLGVTGNKVLGRLESARPGDLAGGPFEPDNDVLRFLTGLRRTATARLAKADRATRGDLMIAAHTVAAMSSVLAELASERWTRYAAGFGLRPLGWQMMSSVLAVPVPVPSPTSRLDEFQDDMLEHFRHAAGSIVDYLRMAADDRRLGHLETFIIGTLPAAAFTRYHKQILAIGAKSPEFMIWTLLRDTAPDRYSLDHYLRDLVGYRPTASAAESRVAEIRSELRRGAVGLAGLQAEATPWHRGPAAPDAWTELAGIYRAEVAREAAEDGPSGPRHPPLRLAYVNPAFRAVSHLAGRDQPHEEGWWDGVPVDEEIQEFLTRYLASPSATALPLLVLGHPGAGKSVFTRVLAARLGAIDYSVVRVDLRAVAADAPIYQQISTALEKSLTRRVEWAELTRAARREAPVVFLDGLDELIQSSAVSRADYLEQVREFQRTELDRGCPVIVVVTSRTVVAHRVRIPDGTVVLRLEPFDEPRIRRWLDGWNRHNAGYFASAPVSPLKPETVLAHPGLAAQPLLLFMLALYDSGDNALQNEGDSFGGSDLYERLLQEFAHREIRKHQPYAEDSELKQLVETELETLSIAAFAMFNRGRLAVLEGELDADLGAFRAASARGGQAARSDTARKLVSRFFFVHVSQGKAIDAGEERTASAYEFLHATFGEYLVARLTFGALLHTHESGRRGGNSLNMMGAAPDYGLLGALLSFELLCARNTVIGFLRDAADRIGRAKRRLLVALLIDGLQEALAADGWNGIAGYRPREASVPARLSVRTANLVQLLLVLGGPTAPPELFPDSADPAEQWRSLVSLWQATLSAQSWQLLSDTVGAVERDGGLRIDLDPVMMIGDDYENHRSLESFLRWGELAGDPDVQWIFDTIRPLLRIAPPRGVRPWSAALLTAFAFGNLREAHTLAVIADDASEALLNAVIGLLPVLPGPMPPEVLAAVLDAYDSGVDDDEPLIDLLLDAVRPDRGIPPEAEEFRGLLSALAGRIRWIEKTRRRVEAAIALAGLGMRDHDLPYGLWLVGILRDETYLALLAGDQRLTARLLEVVRLTGRRKAAARAAHLLTRIQDPDPWLLRDIDVRYVLDSARRPEPAIALMAEHRWHDALRRQEIGRIAGLLRAGLSRRDALHRVASVLRAAAGDRNHRAGL